MMHTAKTLFSARLFFFLILLLGIGLGTARGLAAESPPSARPNVLLIMTDDQGYGDLGCHGNTMVRTPRLDALSRQGVRLTNFHVDPTCSETRSALMTGRYSCRTGVWHTVMGRSILGRSEFTMGQQFQQHGYDTAMFGKWHLGDNFPYRPHDRGFQEALYHGGGGVGQTPDVWGNDYFDDTYFRRGVPEAQQGYCTDVWFREATRFIERHRADQPAAPGKTRPPFFCYVATNAPHSPYLVDGKYSQPYEDRGVGRPMAQFYGMIENIDENVGRLLDRLTEWKLAENTIVIFLTDNGSAAGTGQAAGGKKKGGAGKWPGFTAGMRAQKGSQYEGGHRVPCFIRWPAGGVAVDREIGGLAAHFDLLPTLTELCGLQTPASVHWDGTSLAATLRDPAQPLPARTLVVHSQRVDHPEQWRKCSVMTDRWRLIDGQELYDLPADPGQQTDIAAKHPEVVRELRSAYEKWWQDVSRGPHSQGFANYVAIPLGDPQAEQVALNCMDWHTDISQIPWSQSNIAGNPNAEANGFWAVEVVRPGRYEFTLRARPDGIAYAMNQGQARLQVGDVTGKSDIAAGAASVKISVDLPAGPARLQTWLAESGRGERGAFFVEVRYAGGHANLLRDRDRVVLLGGTWIERLQGEGYLETILTASLPQRKLTFRNLGWSGDTVWGESRALFGTPADGFKRLIADTLLAKPTVLAIGYGQVEAFAGEEGLPAFRAGYQRLLDALAPTQARLILIAPPQLPRLPAPLPALDSYNRDLGRYRNAIRQLAAERKASFLDWYDLVPQDARLQSQRLPLFSGNHWTSAGEWAAGPRMADSLGAPDARWKIDLDVQQSRGEAERARLSQLEVSGQRLSLQLLPEFLPAPPLPIQDAHPLEVGDRITRPVGTVRVRGLEASPSRLVSVFVAGTKVLETSVAALATGVEIPTCPDVQVAEQLRHRIRDKNALFFHRHRPQNETYLLLFRKHEQGNNAVEIPQFDPLIAQLEEEIRQLNQPHPFRLEIHW